MDTTGGEEGSLKLNWPRCGFPLCPLVAHRVNSRQRSTSVAFGAKRTLTEPRSERPKIAGEPDTLGWRERRENLSRDHSSRRGTRRLFRWRDHKCHPGIPAVGAVLVGKFPVALEIEVPLCRGAQGNDEPELRANADHARLEAPHPIAGTAVATDLLVDVTDGTDKKLFR